MEDKLTLSELAREVIKRLQNGYILRWEKSIHHEPFIQKRGEIEEYTVPVKVFFDLIEHKLVKARNTRSIVEYYDLTENGKDIHV